MRDKEYHTCQCCGYKTITGKFYDVCPICYWEDDPVQNDNPASASAANNVSLLEAQRNYASFGASEEAFIKDVRKPTAEDERDSGWIPLYTQTKRYIVKIHVKEIWLQGEKRAEFLSYYQWFNIEASLPEEAEMRAVELVQSDQEIEARRLREKEKRPPQIFAEEIKEVEEFKENYPGGCSGRIFYSAKRWWQFWI